MHRSGWHASEMKCRLTVVEPMQREAGDPMVHRLAQEKDSGDGVTRIELEQGKRESGRIPRYQFRAAGANKSPLRTEVKDAEPHTLVSPSYWKQLEAQGPG